MITEDEILFSLALVDRNFVAASRPGRRTAVSVHLQWSTDLQALPCVQLQSSADRRQLRSEWFS
jgi:hypothetical protein